MVGGMKHPLKQSWSKPTSMYIESVGGVGISFGTAASHDVVTYNPRRATLHSIWKIVIVRQKLIG